MGVAAALSVRLSATTTDLTRGFNEVDAHAQKLAASVSSGFTVPAMGTFGKSLSEIGTAFISLQGALAGLGISKLVGDFIGTASKLTDLAAKTSITIRELQRLEFAGAQVGVSLDTISTAASQLQKRLAGDDKGAASAVQELGLNLNHLLSLGAGEQFEAIASALAKMENPARQTFLAMELFGRGGAQLLPLLRSDTKALGDEMERLGLVMSDRTVKAADDLGDVWTKMGFAGTRFVAEALRPMLEHMEKLPGEQARLKNFLEVLKVDSLIPAWRQLVGLMAAARGEGIEGKVPGAPKGFGSPNLEGLPALLDPKEATKLFEDSAKAADHAADAWKRFLDAASGKDQIVEAKKWMRAIDEVGLTTIAAAGNQDRMNTVLEKALLVYAALGQTAPAAMAKVWAATIPRPEVITGINNLIDAQGRLMLGTRMPAPTAPMPPLPGGPGVIPGLGGLGMPGTSIPIGTIDHLFVNPFREAFGNLGKQLPNLIFGTLMAGGSVVGAIASGLGSEFARLFQERLAAASKSGTALGGAATGLGLAGMGLSAGLGGFAMGQQFGKTKGALAGAASGALAGAAFGSVVPVIGTALGAGIGGIAGLIGGFFGGRSKDKKDKKAMEEERQKLLDQFGGMENLSKLAKDLGVDIDLAFTTKKPMEFQAAVESLNEALEKQQGIIKATGEILEGVNARAANVTSQGDLDVVGAGAVAAFALQIQAGKSAIVAFQALTPAITAMREAMAGGNFTLTESAQRLMDLGGVLEANSVQFTNLGASGQILSAMLQGNIRDGTLFAAVATDIGTQIQTVIDRGVPMAQVFALAQPQLQALWEAQQKWGFSVDDTTQALLTEAEAQGFVGVAMKSVNEQILSVLLAIGKVLGADIPAALANLPGAAASAAAGMNAAFDTVRGPSIDGDFMADDIPAMAEGGIVRRPTLAMIGEAGPEAVVPLNGAFTEGSTTVILEADGRPLAEIVVPHIPGVVQRYGLA